MKRINMLVLGVVLSTASGGWGSSLWAAQSDDPAPAPRLEPPATVTPAATEPAPGSAPARVPPLMEGPLHEAFLPPAKDRAPDRVEKSPPAPIVERPGVDPPDPKAQWIEGYWQWDDSRNDFVWVTGTWR